MGLSKRSLRSSSFFDFRLGIDGAPASIAPTLSKRSAICAFLVLRRANLLLPIERALFCLRSSQVLSVESPATVPVLKLTLTPSWIATSLWQTHDGHRGGQATAKTVPAKMTFMVNAIQPI